MAAQSALPKTNSTLDELIDHAIELPPETQDFLLMIAKAMRYTHQNMSKSACGQPHTSSKCTS